LDDLLEAVKRRTILAAALAALGVLVAGCATDVQSTSDNPGGGIAINSAGFINANAVLQKLEDDGWPVGDGIPASHEFRTLTGKARCTSSKTFVRTGADSGWGFICLNMPADVYAKVQSVFDKALMIMAPLYLDSGRDLVIFGFGWPGDSSQKFADSLGTTGNYLLPPDPAR
jgi:hypothetical protein